MTQNPPQARPPQTFQVQPRVRAISNQPILHANTFSMAVSQGNLYLDFASISPADLSAIYGQAAGTGETLVDVPIDPFARLLLPLETAQQLLHALQQHVQTATGSSGED